jgi:hypothetical protein
MKEYERMFKAGSLDLTKFAKSSSESIIAGSEKMCVKPKSFNFFKCESDMTTTSIAPPADWMNKQE